MTSRAYGALRGLAHFKKALSSDVGLLLVRSLSAVHLDYCSIADLCIAHSFGSKALESV